MATYFVGDIQGCFDELQALLATVAFNPAKDELYAVGDLIARGDKSLETLRFFKKNAQSAFTVLGNHELNFFAVNAGLKRANPKDKLQPLLTADDLPILLDFLREQPLGRELTDKKIVMTHAGVPPQWQLAQLRNEAALVSEALKQTDYIDALISKMYGDKINAWEAQVSGVERLIYTINALTRMRFLHADGSLDFACKLPPEALIGSDSDLQPWFMHSSQLEADYHIVFGHWAALMGHCQIPHIHALDTGCVWGESLTLWHYETNELISQPSISKEIG